MKVYFKILFLIFFNLLAFSQNEIFDSKILSIFENFDRDNISNPLLPYDFYIGKLNSSFFASKEEEQIVLGNLEGFLDKFIKKEDTSNFIIAERLPFISKILDSAYSLRKDLKFKSYLVGNIQVVRNEYQVDISLISDKDNRVFGEIFFKESGTTTWLINDIQMNLLEIDKVGEKVKEFNPFYKDTYLLY